jgi:hypothetical protein
MRCKNIQECRMLVNKITKMSGGFEDTAELEFEKRKNERWGHLGLDSSNSAGPAAASRIPY